MPGHVKHVPPADGVPIAVTHADHPTLTFVVWFTSKGVAAGLEVWPVDTEITIDELSERETAGLPPRIPENAPRLTARAFREIRLGEIQNSAYAFARGNLDRSPRHPGISLGLLEASIAFRDEPRPGQKGRPDRWYAKVADAYVELIDAGVKNPVAQLADQLGFSTSHIRSALHQARHRGLLTRPTSAGVASGTLTDKARQLLATEDLSGADDTRQP